MRILLFVGTYILFLVIGVVAELRVGSYLFAGTPF